MEKRSIRLALSTLALTMIPALSLASPLKVKPGGEGQKVIMCPHCKEPIAVTQAGDYTVAFSGEEIHPKTGWPASTSGSLIRPGGRSAARKWPSPCRCPPIIMDR